MSNIYSEIKDLEFSNTYIRTYNVDVNQEDLVWETNEESIILEPLFNRDWKIQFKNMIPVFINEKISIKKNEQYRLIKGEGVLKLRIYK